MKNPDVVIFGRSCVDYIAVVDKFPDEDKKVPFEFRLIEAGGQGSTSSCCISRLGSRAVYIGNLGSDDEGRFCLRRLKDFNVNTKYVNIVKHGKTPIAYLFITKSDGKRTIIYEPCSLPRIQINNRIKKLLSHTKTILLDPEVTYLARDINSIKNEDKIIIYDCERWRDGIADIMETADYFIPTSDFLLSKELDFETLSFHEKILGLNQMVNGRLVVTNGRDGAYYMDNNKLIHVPAPKVNVRDTTGAGDNFHAAFAFALCRNYNLSEAVRFSVAVASLSCREYGGRNGIPDMSEAVYVCNELQEKIVDM